MENIKLVNFLEACRYMGVDPFDAVDLFAKLDKEKGKDLTIDYFATELNKLVKN